MGILRLPLFLILLVCFDNFHSIAGVKNDYIKDIDLKDNEFADFDAFEEFDSEFEIDEKPKNTNENVEQLPRKDDFNESEKNKKVHNLVTEQSNIDDDDTMVDVEDADEYEHEHSDTEEFENINITPDDYNKDESNTPPVISFVNLPHNYPPFGYYFEVVLIIGVVVYFVNHIIGRTKNLDLVTAWFNANSSILNDNFSLVGDDLRLNSEEGNCIRKESDNLFTLWCSGRTCCEGMLVELKCLKRQDLFSYALSHFLRENLDQIHIKIALTKEDMDTYVFCIANKRISAKLSKEMIDLSTYCPERKPGNKYGLPNNFVVMSEINSVREAFLDSRTLDAFERFSDYIDYVHISDRFSGPKIFEETLSQSANSSNQSSKTQEYRRMMLVGFSLAHGRNVNEMVRNVTPLLSLVLYWLDKLKRIKLNKESKTKAEMHRARVEQVLLKSTHAARNEAAAARREEKRRKERERMLEEDDPEKQRKWEEKEMKKQMKRMVPKMKQLKVKAL